MDIHLPEGAEGFPRHLAKIEAACRAGMAIPKMIGMVIAGSFAVGIADEYSDVDLQLVARDEDFAQVVTKQDDVIVACGNAIARFSAEHTGLPELTIVLYDDLVHVDFLPIRISEVAAKGQGLPAVVLWERDGSVTRELSKPEGEKAGPDLEWLERRVWTWFWYVQSKILRGEVYEALDGLAWLRITVLFPLLGATRGTTVSSARRIEPLMNDLADSFARTAGGVDQADALGALRASAELYTKLADPLLKEHGVELATEARATVNAAMDAGLEWRPPA